ncbi:MAG TPA: alginate lyase family protein [Candidatus Acidoferrales bacterium]|nr:alginate lyase family protein [Candidatus Acidoferrales bacterium]
MIARLNAALRPKPVFCVIEHAHHNRALADAVCAGEFTENGVTLSLGVPPDWVRDGLPQDEEWRIAWSKFYFGLDLAAASAETGEPRFLRTWEILVDSWMRQVPVACGPTDAIARRIQNWIYAWNIFADAPRFSGLSGGLDENIVASLRHQACYLREHLTAARNHRTLELYALFLLACALPEAADADLIDFSMQALYQNLVTDIRADGVHCEHSTHYHMIVLRTFLAARENARRLGLAFPAGYDERLERACEYAMHCHRPDGGIPTLSDSDAGSYGDLLQLASSLLGRRDFLYAATAGVHGTPPRKRYVDFPDAGYYIQRSGWGENGTPFQDERFLIFDCGTLGDGGHGHYDLLSMEAAAGGKPLIVDPGRYTYSEHPPNLRRWFKGTAAHNTVQVDRLDQTPYRCGKPKQPLPEARLLERWSAPGLDVLWGMAESPCYEVRHTRRIFFINDEYWVISDSLAGDLPHRYDLRFHMAPEASGNTCIVGNTVRAPGLALTYSPGSELQLNEGWVAPQYGLMLRAPVISASIDGVCSAEFVTVLAPVDLSRPAPGLVVRSSHSSSGTAELEITGAGEDGHITDELIWSSSPAGHEAGPFQCHASVVWRRFKDSGDTLCVVACNAQRLSRLGAALFDGGREAGFHAGQGLVPWLHWNPDGGCVTSFGRFE